MKRYKLIADNTEYPDFITGHVYHEDFKLTCSSSVKHMANTYPEDWELVEELTFPREMEVVFGCNTGWVKRIVLGIFYGQAVCVQSDYTESFNGGKIEFFVSPTAPSGFREIPEKQEMTIAEIEKALGKSIKIVK